MRSWSSSRSWNWEDFLLESEFQELYLSEIVLNSEFLAEAELPLNKYQYIDFFAEIQDFGEKNCFHEFLD